ncbi:MULTISPECIES: hypothetical protein [unclassified Cyanobium]|uniref:hypothetical protein n=1 Tax=unclassified Cyanobium TaxID=2627006 RepID=UPI0020CD7D6A|nr:MULTISPECIES: hypothetical protein [unclassified Cyanobium]MCP9777896.1 hypothetical protein [Cyanobium sp. Tous-M-B4]MCP9875605.1 hypothetical protein [Cyanobium sp. A2C-AMD]
MKRIGHTDVLLYLWHGELYAHGVKSYLLALDPKDLQLWHKARQLFPRQNMAELSE